MSNTPMMRKHNSVAANTSRKRRFTTCEDRVPTPYPILAGNRSKIFNKYIDSSAEDASPEAKKAFIQPEIIKSIPNENDPLKDATNDNEALEKLKSGINGIIDGMLERMTSKIEDLRKKLLNEISEIFGEEEENVFESFEEGQFELKTDKELFDGDEEIFGEEFDKVSEGKVVESESKSKTEEEEKVDEEKVIVSETGEVVESESNTGESEPESLVIYDLSFEA